MTEKIVNLRMARKRKARAEARGEGDVRAAKFGEAKAGRVLREAEKDKKNKDLDGKKRE